MYNTRYFKAICTHCEGHIEFPETAVGMMIDCPHCAQKTQLRVAKLAPATEPDEDDVEEEEEEEEPTVEKKPTPPSAPVPKPQPQSQPRRSGPSLVLILGIVCPIVLLVVLGLFLNKMHQSKSAVAPPPVKAVAGRTNAPTNAVVQTNPPAPPPPPRPKSLSDLKVGALQFDKTKGSSLVYAVGTIENDSEYQHFGVRITLDLFDKNGDKVGTAQDYKTVIEPNKSWRFRALITDFKAVSAKVAEIKEVE